MDELINLKYLTQNNGYWQYERRVPKAVLSHPYWGQKKSWKRPLGLKVGAPVEDVLSVWKELHQTFETALANIKERNPHILDKRERRRRAEAHLKMFNLRPHDGSLAGIEDDMNAIIGLNIWITSGKSPGPLMTMCTGTKPIK